MCGYVMRTKLYMNKFGLLFGAAILALASMPTNAALIRYTDPVKWMEAFKTGSISGSIYTDTFANNITPSQPAITLDSGIVSTVSDVVNVNLVVGKQYRGVVGKIGGSTANTWKFPDPDPVLGFFGYIDGLIVGDVLKVTVLGDEFFVSENGGFGVLGDDLDSDLFSDVVWESATDMSLSFTIGVGMDDFSYTGFSYTGTDPGSPVPAPPALWLFVAGLLGLIGFKRRSKAA
jgi:hypothetical protein